MAIDRDTVIRVANLARLELTDTEMEQMTGQMAGIVPFVEKINELDTEGIEPAAHVLDVRNRVRPDEVIPSPATVEELIALAPDSGQNMIRVPRVIE